MKLAVIQGLEDYIVAESGNVLLICKKNEEQRIKHFSDRHEAPLRGRVRLASVRLEPESSYNETRESRLINAC